MPLPTSDAATLIAALPRLTHETELQKMLADEKMRSEQHKTNYQTLKAEHTRLQDEYVSLQNELKTTIEETRLVQEKYKSLLQKAQSDISSKHRDNEDLRSQVLSEEKVELMKLQLHEDVEKPYREKFTLLDAEVEKYRSEYNKLKYEYSFLKTEYEHERQESQRVVEEMRLRHEAEVSNLRKERETLIARHQTDGSGEGQRVRVLQRENAQLNLKVKGLLTELEEIRAQREHLGLQSDSVTRLQNKQLAEHSANVKALQTERESLQRQCENLQRELSASSDLHTQLTGKVHDLEKENIILKNRADEVTHKSKVELTNLKMSLVKERGDMERQRDKLKNEVEEVRSQMEIAKHSCDMQSNTLVEKERETVRRIEAAREEEWKKIHTLENEKMELETKLQELERRRMEEEGQRHTEREKAEDRLRSAHDAKETAEKEALVYKTKVSHQESLLQQLERERLENGELKSRLHRIESQYSSYVNTERELVEVNEKLKGQVERLSSDLSHTQNELRGIETKTEHVLMDSRSSWQEEKSNLQRRVDELETQCSDYHSKLNTANTAYSKKKKRFARLISKLKDRANLYSAKVEELEIEREALKKSVPLTAHAEMKKKLRDLMRRHQDFRSLLLTSSVNQVPVGEMSFGSVSMPLDFSTVPANILFADTTKDLEALRERLDVLDDHQKQQLRELKGGSPLNTPIKIRPERDTDGALALSDLDSDGEGVKSVRSLSDRDEHAEDILVSDG